MLAKPHSTNKKGFVYHNLDNHCSSNTNPRRKEEGEGKRTGKSPDPEGKERAEPRTPQKEMETQRKRQRTEQEKETPKTRLQLACRSQTGKQTAGTKPRVRQ